MRIKFIVIVSVSVLLYMLSIAIAQENGEEKKVTYLSEPPTVLQEQVDFLAAAPQIDGELDAPLQQLPIRKFSMLLKTSHLNPDIDVNYRIAYGTRFFYLYIEVDSDEITYRDRAFQNGDGFHFVLGLPQENDTPTDEFYVLAGSAVNNSLMNWTRSIFWYHNIYNIFQRPSEQTLMQFKVKDGKTGFELLLPWSDVHPLHPWFSRGIGFNIAFVKGIGENDSNYYQLMGEIEAIKFENSKREYAHLKFQKPSLDNGYQTFAMLDKNHMAANQILNLKVATVAAQQIPIDSRIAFNTGENETAEFDSLYFKAIAGLSFTEFALLQASLLNSGGYSFVWKTLDEPNQYVGLSVLPKVDMDTLQVKIESAKTTLRNGSYQTLKFMVEETRSKLEEIRDYQTCAGLRQELAKLSEIVEKMEQGHDFFKEETGFLRRAYQSQFDNTYQPYVIKVPENYDPQKKYPMVLFLHGSASDETDIFKHTYLTNGDYIFVGPRGRGPSTLYHFDNAQVDITEVIDAVATEYSVDLDNIVLTGFSMGGYGVYRTFAETPEKFKALAIFSGLIGFPQWDFIPYYGSNPEFLKLVKSKQIFIFHGELDNNAPFPTTKKFAEEMKAAGAVVEFYPDETRGHERPGSETVEAFAKWLKMITGR